MDEGKGLGAAEATGLRDEKGRDRLWVNDERLDGMCGQDR